MDLPALRRAENSMSKKHFIDLASTIRFMSPALSSYQINDLADFCQRHSANFDRDRFLAACEAKRKGDK